MYQTDSENSENISRICKFFINEKGNVDEKDFIKISKKIIF